ncbi:unnamed protein product [Cyprideis torosa]|uniref:Uncharacterized protein n=1 Tax=Cyprideis torosa TaxID=163714 RepID=A0A7R8ZJE7_9CRUS|nr:unnamed protein product [Cyprideis torosa]CAG0886796.1 unnamed protein product [Cyprideis torosa]
MADISHLYKTSVLKTRLSLLFPRYSCLSLCVDLNQVFARFINRLIISVLSCALVSDLLKMNALIEKEPSGFEPPRADDGYALSKFDGMEFSLADHHQYPESGETAPLTDVALRFKDNNNRTGGAPDQIEVSDEEGTERKEKNTRGNCQQKKRFTCAVCGKSLSTKQHLRSHEFTHTGEKPFACRICGKAFADGSALGKHKLVHTGDKPFACRICRKSFAQSGHLSTHEVCGKAFADRSTLASHKLIHTGEKPFACRICGKSFALISYLSSHKLTHTGKKPFDCSNCGKAFRSKTGLRYHEKKHSEGNYHLSRHNLTHENGKRFHCSVCGKGFRTKEGFQGHTEKHSKEEQSVCAMCGEPFRRVEDLEKHLKWHIQGSS